MHTKGKAFLLKIGNGESPPRYTTVAGLRVVSEQIGATVSIKAHGIFLGSKAENTVRAHALAGTVDDYELSYEDGTKLHRRFLVKRFDYAGDWNGERNYTVELESADGNCTTVSPAYVAAFEAMVEALEKVIPEVDWMPYPNCVQLDDAVRAALQAARIARGDA